MNGFNGFTKVEIEMMLDQMKKTLPALISIAPVWAELTKSHFEELKKQGFEGKDAMYMAIQSTGKMFGFK